MNKNQELSDLTRLFTDVIRRMSKEWKRQLNLKINPSQFFILKKLYFDGPQKVTNLAEEMQITPSAISGASDKLVDSAYVERKGAKNDRRVVFLELTETGKDLVQSVLDDQQKVTERFFEGLSEDDIQQLHRIYTKLSDNLSKAYYV